MKYTTASLYALLPSLHPGLKAFSKPMDFNPILSNHGLNNVKSRNYFVHGSGVGLQADVGILSPTRIRLLTTANENFTCPTSCTNEVLCECAFGYASTNAVGPEMCASVIATSCKNPDEIAACSPNPYFLAIGNYFYCPLFQCFDASGIGMYRNETKEYFECFCEARTNLCEECKKLEDTVPYCKYFMSINEELCSRVISCCATETTMEGLTSCSEIWCDCGDVSTNTSSEPTEPAKNKTIPEEIKGLPTTAANSDESTNVALSFGQWFGHSKQIAVALFHIFLL
jgi:hypothetical protein